MRESEIQAEIKKALALRGTPVWRNAVGFDRATKVHYGIGLGSPDLVGILPLVIGPEHVGRTLGVFLGVEVKTPIGRLSQDQKRWHTVARDRGALVVVARSVEDALTGAVL